MTGRKSPNFFGTRSSRLKKLRDHCSWTTSTAPFFNNLSTAAWISSGLFLVPKESGVWVRGGGKLTPTSLFLVMPDSHLADSSTRDQSL